jgi:hypothetical protein
MRAGDHSGKVGDRRDQRRPRLRRCIAVGPIVAARMKTERPKSKQGRDASLAQIVPEIGCAMANNRRADSGDPVGAGGN